MSGICELGERMDCQLTTWIGIGCSEVSECFCEKSAGWRSPLVTKSLEIINLQALYKIWEQ